MYPSPKTGLSLATLIDAYIYINKYILYYVKIEIQIIIVRHTYIRVQWLD